MGPNLRLANSQSQSHVSWIDLSKPVEVVNLTVCHPLDISYSNEDESTMIRSLAQFKGLSVTFTNGQGSSVGASALHSPSHYQNPKRCFCQYEHRKKGRDDEWPFGISPHHHLHSWKVNGQFFKTLRIWKSIYVDGLQFVAEDGSASPVWGICEVDANAEIKFGRSGSGENTVSEMTGTCLCYNQLI